MDVYKELRKIWDAISTDYEGKNATFDIRVHKKLLDIFQVGDYFYYIVNVRKSVLEMVSHEMELVLGYPQETITLDFLVGLIHPDDLPFFLNFEVAVGKFMAALSGERLFKYKVQYDFRAKKANGEYIKILHQYVVIQKDIDNVLTFAVDTDITNLKKEHKPALSFIGMDGEPSYLNVDVDNVFKPTKHIFTKREREIVKALASGMSSVEIAETLSISRHTVDSHRKNMIKKTEAKSTNEVIQIAFNNGWV
ncbi:LuxR C-terminal-related transcriptional regulator [Flavobacterium subsaxonicum]|uniref:LuxR C-terminal-related transcriptional regulator n=1 Tax=Flavobacterium subsaxonicum TaxID=426226 RepID=UPI00041F0336|nr:LuxR C-terminal-related transcriptional regulator [Flavobacterium subsaxonicum]